MTYALIDNGSLEPAAHRNLRAVARALAEHAGVEVAAVSWKHSDRIRPVELGGVAAWTVGPWIAARRARGERAFTFVPFFVSAQGAIGTALRGDLDILRSEMGDFEFSFTDGLAAADLASILADRIRETAAEHALSRPSVIVTDHGGPSPASAALRDAVAARLRDELGSAAGPVAAASMESPEGPEFAFNQPLLAGQLAAPGFESGDVVIAPLFLSPGRHAGEGGDLAKIARAAEAAAPGLRCYLTGLVGTHPSVPEILARALSAVPQR